MIIAITFTILYVTMIIIKIVVDIQFVNKVSKTGKRYSINKTFNDLDIALKKAITDIN
jgi:hypothetical protein